MTPHERDAVILVVVAHPDDAEITAGGTIALLTAAGARVVVAVLSLPERGVQGDLRREMTEQSASILGYELIWPLQPIVHQVSDVNEDPARLDARCTRPRRTAQLCRHALGRRRSCGPCPDLSRRNGCTALFTDHPSEYASSRTADRGDRELPAHFLRRHHQDNRHKSRGVASVRRS